MDPHDCDPRSHPSLGSHVGTVGVPENTKVTQNSLSAQCASPHGPASRRTLPPGAADVASPSQAPSGERPHPIMGRTKAKIAVMETNVACHGRSISSSVLASAGTLDALFAMIAALLQMSDSLSYAKRRPAYLRLSNDWAFSGGRTSAATPCSTASCARNAQTTEEELAR